MFKLERKELKGDRSRAKIHTPSETVKPIFENGVVKVMAKTTAGARVLKSRHGFKEVAAPQARPCVPAPVKAQAKPQAKAAAAPKKRAKKRTRKKPEAQ